MENITTALPIGVLNQHTFEPFRDIDPVSMRSVDGLHRFEETIFDDLRAAKGWTVMAAPSATTSDCAGVGCR